MRTTQTKSQQRRREQYLRQLKRCGFRSWKAANRRRAELIDRLIDRTRFTDAETDELNRLQHLADLYIRWKTNDDTGRSIRRLKRWLKRLEEG